MYGLLFKKPSRWSAIASISWGLVIGVITRYVLEWDMGPQVYAQLIMTSVIFLSSNLCASIYKTRKASVLLISTILSVLFIVVFFMTTATPLNAFRETIAIIGALSIGFSLYGFSKLFASETDEQRKIVQTFFIKLNTPVDVAKEVFGAGKKQISTFPLVGGTTIVMGLLMSLIFITDLQRGESIILGVLVGIMILFGIFMWYFGKKSEVKSAEQMMKSQE
jgi:hypothetical protein